MKENIKQQWIENLRSGKFKKGVGTLRRKDFGNEDEFCCLGVLCEMAVEAGIIEPPVIDSYDTMYVYNEGTRAYLPYAVVQWAGLTNCDPKIESTDYLKTLSQLNDAVDTFEPIIDALESGKLL